MIHNTHTIQPNPFLNGYVCISHNFPEVVGEGATEPEALRSMQQKLQYLADNDPKGFAQNIQSRVKSKLLCRCGVKLEETPLGVWNQEKVQQMPGDN